MLVNLRGKTIVKLNFSFTLLMLINTPKKKEKKKTRIVIFFFLKGIDSWELFIIHPPTTLYDLVHVLNVKINK